MKSFSGWKIKGSGGEKFVAAGDRPGWQIFSIENPEQLAHAERFC
jgi:hypothetical protein